MAYALRDWQNRCKEKYSEKLIATGGKMLFKVEACVAAGKSKMMAELAYQHLLGEWAEEYPLDFVIFVAPNTAIIGEHTSRNNSAYGIIGALEDRGIWAEQRITPNDNRMDFDFNPEPRQSAAGMTGVAAVMTYHYFQQDRVARQILNWCAAGKKIGVFLDEIQFVPDCGSAWSDSTTRLDEAVQLWAPFSATWWRTDKRLIFGQDKERLENDFTYTYGEAIQDGIVRPLSFWLPNTIVKVKDFDGMVVDERSIDQFMGGVPQEIKQKLLDPNGWFVEQMIRRAAFELECRRTMHVDAACLTICPPGFHDDDDESNQAQNEQNRIAEIIHKRLEKILGVKACLILHGDPPKKIQEFRESTEKFIVAVNKISIGADIPRLRVLNILRDLSGTRLLFDQILGRIARRQSHENGDAALVVMPPFDGMCRFAAEQLGIQKDYKPKATNPCPKCNRLPCKCPRSVCPVCQTRPCQCSCRVCKRHPCICRKDIPFDFFIEQQIKNQHLHAGEYVEDQFATIAMRIRNDEAAFRHIDIAQNGQFLEKAAAMMGGFASNAGPDAMAWKAQRTGASWASIREGIPIKVRNPKFAGLFSRTDDKEATVKYARAWSYINKTYLSPYKWKQIYDKPNLLTMEKLVAIDNDLDRKISRK